MNLKTSIRKTYSKYRKGILMSFPARIQDRDSCDSAADTRPVFTWKLATAIVVPAMMILFFLIYNGSPVKAPSRLDVESMISQVARLKMS